jgi:hypothetical protein
MLSCHLYRDLLYDLFPPWFWPELYTRNIFLSSVIYCMYLKTHPDIWSNANTMQRIWCSFFILVHLTSAHFFLFLRSSIVFFERPPRPIVEAVLLRIPESAEFYSAQLPELGVAVITYCSEVTVKFPEPRCTSYSCSWIGLTWIRGLQLKGWLLYQISEN